MISKESSETLSITTPRIMTLSETTIKEMTNSIMTLNDISKFHKMLDRLVCFLDCPVSELGCPPRTYLNVLFMSEAIAIQY
jgi:hypothetical protein